MKNIEIAKIFYDMADILELQGVDWKPAAYRKAAKSIEALGEDVDSIYKRGGIKLLEEIPGIGENLGKKIEEFIKTGKVSAYEKLKSSVPAHINVLMKVPGMGPKKLKKLNDALNITSVDELEKAARSHRIAGVEGFGEKSEKDILENIALMKEAKERISLKEAEKQANGIIKELKKLKAVLDISAAGSIRRKKSTVGDIDIIVSSDDPDSVIDAFVNLKQVKKVLARGLTKASVILKSGTQSDLRVMAPESWGAGLFYFTGNQKYNVDMRRLAIKQGYKLSEYGLFDRETGARIAGSTEEEVCKKLGTKLLKPEEREL